MWVSSCDIRRRIGCINPLRDGVHFCLLDLGDGITDESPVIMVVPCNPDCPRMVVGESLSEFLALGCVIGFFFLEQLTYDREETVRYLFDWEAFVLNSYFGGAPPEGDLAHLEAQRQLLQELCVEFSLAPWRDVDKRLAALDAKWTAHVQLPD
jgi:hypothetical protein